MKTTKHEDHNIYYEVVIPRGPLTPKDLIKELEKVPPTAVCIGAVRGGMYEIDYYLKFEEKALKATWPV